MYQALHTQLRTIAEWLDVECGEMYRAYKMASCINITELLKQVLIKELEQKEEDRILESEDINELLLDIPEINDGEARKSIIGYPSRPLYRDVGLRLQQWMEQKQCPIYDLPVYDLLDEQTYIQNRNWMIDEVTPVLTEYPYLWQDWSEEERHYRIRDLVKKLGKRGLLDLLGMRKTVGSQDEWPPARKVIENTFNQKHKPESDAILTVGGRALAKHCIRDGSANWWGASTGTEADKNKHASKNLQTILDNATWVNIHEIVHGTVLIEARQEEGYGVRWTHDGEQFRGFLEPQMVNGHEVGWRH